MSIVSLDDTMSGETSLLMGRRRRRRQSRRARRSAESYEDSAPQSVEQEPQPQRAQPQQEQEPEQEQESPQTMGRRASRGPSLARFIRDFKKMNRQQRREAWRAIPKERKAAWLLIAGPVLLPLIAAAGVAVTATAAAMPFTAAMIARKAMLKARKRNKYPRTLVGFVREFRRMSKEERRDAWRSIPKARKAAWLLLAGPVLLPLLAAAGVAITATASAAPFAFLALRKRIIARRKRLAELHRTAQEAHSEAVTATANGDTNAASVALAKEATAKSEISTETSALSNEENQVSQVNKDAGGTGTESTTPEVSPEAIKAADAGTEEQPKKGNVVAALPLAALAALMFL
jgi:hypothetical protein